MMLSTKGKEVLVVQLHFRAEMIWDAVVNLAILFRSAHLASRVEGKMILSNHRPP